MLDGSKPWKEIACGELRWEGARQHAGRIGNRACGECFAGRERYSMLDGQESTEIACRELRWQGARQHAGRRGNGANSLHTMETFGT